MYPGCHRLVMSGRYCQRHQVNTATYRSTAEWRRIRAIVIMEEPICRAVGCNEPSTEVDHIIPLPEGTHRRWNLQALCKSCHSAKTRVEVSR